MFTPEYSIEELTGHVARPAHAWVTDVLPRLRAAGAVVAEFVQLAGEVVYVPEHYPHATLNLQPSIGVEFQVMHGSPAEH